MLSSWWLSWVLTIVFVLTGGFALARLAALVSGAEHSCDRLAELSHLLMSVAMVAMVWAWSGGPESPSGLVQIVVFGLLAAGFLGLTVRPDPGRGRPEGGYHLLMAGSMVWMVAAMPLLMGSMSAAGGDGVGHAGHAGHAGHDMGAMSGTTPAAAGVATPGWASAVSVTLGLALVASTVFWATRVLRPHALRCAQEIPSQPAGPDAGEPGALAVMTAAPTTRSVLPDPRAGALCHALMSAGMAAMLAAML